MKIISHRGFWKIKDEENTLNAFKDSLVNGFGIETDLRYFDNKIVISHDLPNKSCNSFDDLLELYNELQSNQPLALNIKSDGLFDLINSSLQKYKITNYFLFDMSIPDLITCSKTSLNFFTRISELENTPILVNESKGIWIDEFYSHWITNDIIYNFINNGKKVCLVSPELHKRDYSSEWNQYKSFKNSNDFMICTDFPDKAFDFFNN